MAVDTAAKRYSAMNLCDPIGVLLPAPDGTVDGGDRESLLGLYSGIAASGGGGGGGGGHGHGHIHIGIVIGV